MTTANERYEEELNKMAEWIVTHPPEISPELVGGKLADAFSGLGPYLDRESRQAAVRERSDARTWLRVEAERRGYKVVPGWEQRIQYQLGERGAGAITASQREYERPMPRLSRVGSIAIASTRSGSKIVWLTDVDSMSVREAQDYLDAKWGGTRRETVTYAAVVPADGYPYYTS